MKYLKSGKYSDMLGIISSVLCLIHCMVFPLIFIWYRASSVDSGHLLDYFFVFFAGIAVYFSSKKNTRTFIKAGLWFSYITFTVSLLLHETFVFAFYTSFIASVALVFLHAFNFRIHLRQHRSYTRARV